MKIFRWLLSHTFLILLIVAVIYGYMFWGNLAGEDTPAGKALAYLEDEFVEVEEFIAAVKAKQAQLTEKKPAATIAKSEQKTLVSKSYSEHSPVNTSFSYSQQPAVVNNNTASSEVEAGSTPDNKSTPVIAEVKQSDDAALMSRRANITPGYAPAAITTATTAAASDKFIPAEVAKQLDNVDEHGKVIDESQQYDAVRSLWITARKSFYQRNYTLSEQSYQQVISKTNDNVDAYGELGNVYFNQGKNKQAASAYLDAATIMVRNGQISRARSLVGLLQHLDEAQAEKLKQLIASSAS